MLELELDALDVDIEELELLTALDVDWLVDIDVDCVDGLEVVTWEVLELDALDVDTEELELLSELIVDWLVCDDVDWLVDIEVEVNLVDGLDVDTELDTEVENVDWLVGIEVDVNLVEELEVDWLLVD